MPSDRQRSFDPLPLASVAAALHRTPSLAAKEVAELPHAVALVVDFLVSDANRWTIPRACEANLPTLLPRLAARYESSRAQTQARTQARTQAQIQAQTSAGGVRCSSRASPPHDDFDRSDPFFHALECREGLVWAVAHDNLEMLEWLHAHCPSVLPYAAMVKAAECGNLRLLRWLMARHPRAVHLMHVMNLRATRSSNAGMIWGVRHYGTETSVVTTRMLAAAAGNDRLETLEWLCETFSSRPSDLDEAKRAAIRGGHLDVAKFLFGERPEFRLSETPFVCAAKGGKLDMVQWLLTTQFHHYLSRRYAHGYDVANTDAMLSLTVSAKRALHGAAVGGHLDVVRWLNKWLTELTEDGPVQVMASVASGGHLDAVQQIHEQHLDEIGAAAKQQDVESATRLHERHVEQLQMSLVEAVTGGHVEVAKWLHERVPNKTLSHFSMDQVARDGHLDVLRWLHAKTRGECAERGINLAAANGHLEVVEWLAGRRVRYNNNRGVCTVPARLSSMAFDNAVESGHLKVAKWMHARGFVGTPAFKLERVARLGRLDVVKWLDAVGLLGCDRSGGGDDGCRALTTAVQHGHLEVAMYLYPRFGARGFLQDVRSDDVLWIEHTETMMWVYSKDPSAVDERKAREWTMFMPTTTTGEIHAAAADPVS